MAANPLTTTTKISDVIVPELFTPYVIEKTAEKSRILTSGIAMANPKLNELVTAGGLTMNMPYWKDLTGDDEVLSDSVALTPGKIDADKDIAALLMRGRAWGANELAGALAGDDPMAAIGDRVSDYWARQEQKTLVSVLKGVFASSSMAGHVSDITGNTGSAAVIGAEAVLDAKQLLGDSADQLQAIMMHSAVFTKLQKDNVIQYVDSKVGKSDSPVMVPTYLGYQVVVDDGMPVRTVGEGAGAYKEYTTYLFAKGSIGRGEGTPVSLTSTETDRDSLAGEDILINRRAFVIHPMGIKWVGQPVGVTPSNEELATGTNWVRVYEDKNIGLVALKHKIA